MVMKVLSADHAVAWGVRLARAEVVPAFPITPQTLIMELLAEFIYDGEMDADFIPAESEHSVMSVAVGASAGGVRTFTATSSQGLALMHEMLYAAPQTRLPIVMANVNRSLGAAAGIWAEHNDSMPERESGWLQVYVEDGQEALDMTIQAYRLAEDRRVLLPIMVCLDGFILSHTVERLELPDQRAVDDFLPKFAPQDVLDPEEPKTFNPIVPPEYAMEMRYQLDRAMDGASSVVAEVDSVFASSFGRSYGGLLEKYRMDDAEYALITLGTATSTARTIVDELRAAGKRAGLIKLRFMRPFPHEKLREACKGLKALGVFDRSVGFNRFGPVFTEVRNSLYDLKIPITDHIGGIGGRDVTLNDMRDIYAALERSTENGKVRPVTWHGLRGVQR
ncbi:MAG: Pyruvate synthase subunit PorA [Methanomassiliicoccales archaeon PtaU1.Bin124]|nr:MAG: Pyruvate synthase subunit PorA [Methanomassiliicoccales archaeon PtaU1.Bin124]